MNRNHTPHAERQALQGAQAAARAFCRIQLKAANAGEARQAVDEAMARIDAGPAPQAFTNAARAEFARRFQRTYPGRTKDSPGRAA